MKINSCTYALKYLFYFIKILSINYSSKKGFKKASNKILKKLRTKMKIKNPLNYSQINTTKQTKITKKKLGMRFDNNFFKNKFYMATIILKNFGNSCSLRRTRPSSLRSAETHSNWHYNYKTDQRQKSTACWSRSCNYDSYSNQSTSGCF